jgi:thiol:disulfide interchange protein
MATAVLFLLTAIWMQELALMGVHAAALVGAMLLLATGAIAAAHQRKSRAGSKSATALVALRRVAAGRSVTPRSVRTLPAQH